MGYIGYSQSINSLEAKSNGIRPLSYFTKKVILDDLGKLNYDTNLFENLSLRILKFNFLSTSGEWHHTSKFFNKTKFYEIDEEKVDEFLAGDLVLQIPPSKKNIPEIKKMRGDITFIKWSGSRNHPKAQKVTLLDIDVECKGCFYIFNFEGREIRKKVGSNGTFFLAKRLDC